MPCTERFTSGASLAVVRRVIAIVRRRWLHLAPQTMHMAPDAKHKTCRRSYRLRKAIDAANEGLK
jgi:hypothetical protein